MAGRLRRVAGLEAGSDGGAARPVGRSGPVGRPAASGGSPAWGPAWAGLEAGRLWWEPGLGAGHPVFASFLLFLSIFLDLLLSIFSIILDLLLVIFLTPLCAIIRVDPEYAQDTGMK